MYRRPQGRKLAAGHGDRGQGRPWEGIVSVRRVYARQPRYRAPAQEFEVICLL